MPWLYLLAAGLLEIAWAAGLKVSEGFSRPLPSFLTVLAMIGSFGLLAMALRSLPLGTAYAVWVGIGAAGTAIVGTLVFNEPMGASRLFFIALLVAGVLGLKLTHTA
ncbi:multidrug efflux SMR transporter [Lujinxingia vulgaris]|uniref:Multidrug efflux SMR transporter n=1 Tax=Lujinxingia vulgaris TaxID=2600176 RepID=A0A5C6XFV1_9DELT|nr:multidrug efflux SMR transporter [Lujinxingia vulgaris]TXD38283.1 multidrug efflux SMR transporter [Lujinxingia vulgaris]